MQSYRVLSQELKRTIHLCIAMKADLPMTIGICIQFLDIEYDEAFLPEVEKVLATITIIPMIVRYSECCKNKIPFPNSDVYIKLNHVDFSFFMFVGRLPKNQDSQLFEKMMIIQAEHGLNAATFAARVCVSAGASMMKGFSSAITIFCGNLHGGAILKVIEMLDNISSVSQFVQSRINQNQPIYGFGHSVYKKEDPRCTIIKKLANIAQIIYKDCKYLYKIGALEKEMSSYTERGMVPNVDLYAGSLYLMLGIKKDKIVSIFIMNRLLGWAAHILEQKQNNTLIRPGLNYVGKRKS